MPDLADDPRFATNPTGWRTARSLDEAIACFGGRHDLVGGPGLPTLRASANARYNLPSEVPEHPQLSTRDRWRNGADRGRAHPAILPPPIIEGYEQPMGPVPAPV